MKVACKVLTRLIWGEIELLSCAAYGCTDTSNRCKVYQHKALPWRLIYECICLGTGELNNWIPEFLLVKEFYQLV